MAKKKSTSGRVASIRKAIQREKDRVRAESLAAELQAWKKKKGHRKPAAKKAPAKRKRKTRRY